MYKYTKNNLFFQIFIYNFENLIKFMNYNDTDTYKAAMAIYLVTLDNDGIILFFRNYKWANRLEMLTVSLHAFNVSKEKDKEEHIKNLIDMSEKFENILKKIENSKKITETQYNKYIDFLTEIEAYEECNEVKKLFYC